MPRVFGCLAAGSVGNCSRRNRTACNNSTVTAKRPGGGNSCLQFPGATSLSSEATRCHCHIVAEALAKFAGQGEQLQRSFQGVSATQKRAQGPGGKQVCPSIPFEHGNPLDTGAAQMEDGLRKRPPPPAPCFGTRRGDSKHTLRADWLAKVALKKTPGRAFQARPTPLLSFYRRGVAAKRDL